MCFFFFALEYIIERDRYVDMFITVDIYTVPILVGYDVDMTRIELLV